MAQIVVNESRFVALGVATGVERPDFGGNRLVDGLQLELTPGRINYGVRRCCGIEGGEGNLETKMPTEQIGSSLRWHLF